MKKFVLNKIIAGTMAAAIVLSTAVTAFASDTQQITPGNTGSTTVKATVESEAVVWIPTNITISGTPDENKKYMGEGAVIVEGDIAGNQLVTVTPESNISLKQPGKDDIVAQVTQEKTTFTYDDIQNSNSAVTTISADSLSAGEWNSVLHYNVSVDENGYTTLYEYDLSATENDDVKAYYMVPNKNTSPIEAETSSTTGNINLLTSFSNLFTPLTAYAAENNVIDYNGVRYELSDEDTIVIRGQGKMKDNVYAEFTNYASLIDDAKEYFKEKYPSKEESPNDYYDWDKFKEFAISNNTLMCTIWHVVNGYTQYGEESRRADVEEYLTSKASEYVLTMPKTVIVENGINNISKFAFQNCYTLENITIPDSVTEIGARAFFGCSRLTNVEIPNSVTHIGSSAFNGCNCLTDITIPDSVNIMDDSVFYSCKNLQNVWLSKNLTSLNSSTFASCTKLENLYIPASITEIKDTPGKYQIPAKNVFCETQTVYDVFKNRVSPETNIVVAPEMFS